MNVDDLLQSLHAKPRPRLSPFFSTQVLERTREAERRRVPRLLIVYWALFVFFAGTLLLPTTFGAAVAVLAIVVAAFPERVMALFAPLLRG
jgi:hypothetical protein